MITDQKTTKHLLNLNRLQGVSVLLIIVNVVLVLLVCKPGAMVI